MRSFFALAEILVRPKPVSFALNNRLFSSQQKILFHLSPQTVPARIYSTKTDSLALLIEAVQKQDSNAIARMAVEHPRLIVEQTNNDNTALHEAARLGDVTMIEALAKTFSTNFNVNHKCHCYKKRTPLAYAVEGGHEAAVTALFSLGADPNITDERGWTALDYAVKGIEIGNDKKSFEIIIPNILKHKGTANKFPKEAQTIILQIEKEARKQEILHVGFIFSQHSLHIMKEERVKYLDEIKNQKTIRPGKTS